MALRVRNRRHSPPPPNLTASTRITQASELSRVGHYGGSATNDRAWKWFDGIGEVHFGITSGARELSRSTLKVVRWSDPKTPVPVNDGPIADLVDALVSPNGGQAGLLSSFYMNRKVTGECYLLGYPDREMPGQLWFDICSTDEILKAEGQDDRQIRRVRSPIQGGFSSPEEGEFYSLDDVILARIWQPHPRYSDLADSPLKALDSVCEELHILTESLHAKITSRLATSGFLLLDQQIQATNIPTPSGDGSRLPENPLVAYMLQRMEQAILDPHKPSAVVPFIFQVPDVEKAVKWITMDLQIFEVDIKQRAELLARVLGGLDLRPENVEGFSDSNHWSAWSTQDVHMKIDVAPEDEAFAWATTKDYLWPQIRAIVEEASSGAALPEGMDGRKVWDEEEIRRHTVWYDLDNLTVRPNIADSAQQVFDRISVNSAALRRETGISEDDKPTDEEYIRQFGAKYGDPYLATFEMDAAKRIEWDKVAQKNAPPGPDPQTEGPPPKVGPGTPSPGQPGRGNRDTPKSRQPQ